MKPKRYLLIILVVLFVIELAVFIPWALRNEVIRSALFFKPLNSKMLQQHISEVNEIVGEQLAAAPQALVDELAATRLYFILTIKDAVNIQSFVFENNAFSTPETNDEEDLFYSYSSDGTKAAFFAMPEEKRSLPRDWGAQAELYVADTSGPNNPAFPDLGSATMVDATNVQYKQHPDVSNAGEVLFIGWDGQGGLDVLASEEWDIYKAVNGKASFLTNGFMPKWLNDDEFVFLKNDGLYLAKSDMSNVRRIATSSEAIVYNNNRFDISDDGTMLAWTQPQLSQIVIYAINDDGSLTYAQTLSSKAYWALFSPSGTYLAVETIAPHASGREDSPQAKIEFFDLKTSQKVPELVIDFDRFDQKNMYFTDWVLK